MVMGLHVTVVVDSVAHAAGAPTMVNAAAVITKTSISFRAFISVSFPAENQDPT